MSTYCKEVRELGFRFYAALSESLGLEQDYIKKVLGEQEQHMAVNFYPKCPSPELTYGLPAHTVPNALTILMMDEQVAGLQVLKEGRWIAVNPRPNAFIINLGDQLQVRAAGVAAAVGVAAGGAAAGGTASRGTVAVGAETSGTAAGGVEAGGAAARDAEAGGAARVSAAARMINALASAIRTGVDIFKCANIDTDE